MPTVSRGVFRWLLCRGATLEDFADRLNHVWTFGLLLVLACVVSWRHNAERPIHCFPPAEFVSEQTAYINNHCWNSHVISYPFSIFGLPPSDLKPNVQVSAYKRTAEQSHVTLYQWLPLIFCFQALLFKLPNILMYILHGYSGISFEKISSLTEGYEHLNMADRQLLGRQTGRYIYNWCFQFKCLPWRLLTIIWLITKLCFASNAVLQFIGFNKYVFFTNHTLFRAIMIENLLGSNVTPWRNSLAFPREVMCDVSIRQIGMVHRYTFPCDLPANDFNETVCLFLWVWFAIVAMVTCGSLGIWLLSTLIPVGRKRFLSKALFLSDEINSNLVADHDLSSFSSLVGEDGVMVLKLIGSNSSDHVVRDTVYAMWNLRLAELRGRMYHPEDAS